MFHPETIDIEHFGVLFSCRPAWWASSHRGRSAPPWMSHFGRVPLEINQLRGHSINAWICGGLHLCLLLWVQCWGEGPTASAAYLSSKFSFSTVVTLDLVVYIHHLDFLCLALQLEVHGCLIWTIIYTIRSITTYFNLAEVVPCVRETPVDRSGMSCFIGTSAACDVGSGFGAAVHAIGSPRALGSRWRAWLVVPVRLTIVCFVFSVGTKYNGGTCMLKTSGKRVHPDATCFR